MFRRIKRLSKPFRGWFDRSQRRRAAFMKRDVLPLSMLVLESRIVPTVDPWGPTRPLYEEGQVPAFSDLTAIPPNVLAQKSYLNLTDMRAVSVDRPALTSLLAAAPFATLGTASQDGLTVALPTPDGKS